jgi:hypothetical protein
VSSSATLAISTGRPNCSKRLSLSRSASTIHGCQAQPPTGLGDLALEQADLETASGRSREALVRCFEAEEPRSFAYSLAGWPLLPRLRGDVNRAGTLWSALKRIEEERAAEVGRGERERNETRLRTLVPAEPAGAVADGRQLPLGGTVRTLNASETGHGVANGLCAAAGE